MYVGAVTGDKMLLSSEILRSADIQISGSGLGSWTKEEIQQLFKIIIPEMFKLAAEKKLQVDTQPISIRDIENYGILKLPAERGW